MSAAATIAVLGAGAWGSALAQSLARGGHAVRLWARDAGLAGEIAGARTNRRYLPGVTMHDGIRAGTDLGEALDGAACVLAVTPAQTLAGMLGSARAAMPAGVPVVLCAKGIDAASGRLLSQVAGDVLPDNPIAALSGPSFAVDVAAGLPTAVTVAADEAALAGRLAALLSSATLRCYSSDDLAGVEAGGALKNVIAIAAGTVIGAGLGASAQAALVTRGFVELRRLAASFGARPETPMGLSGFGDLMLTCGSGKSRNFSYGLALGGGESLEGRPLAEGVATARIARRLAAERGIEAPITESVALLLDRAVTVGEAMAMLLSRPLKSED